MSVLHDVGDTGKAIWRWLSSNSRGVVAICAVVGCLATIGIFAKVGDGLTQIKKIVESPQLLEEHESVDARHFQRLDTNVYLVTMNEAQIIRNEDTIKEDLNLIARHTRTVLHVPTLGALQNELPSFRSMGHQQNIR